jgi:EAL domain-containing protein (putative c-di-GMP-specific phosphodiesterase class I)
LCRYSGYVTTIGLNVVAEGVETREQLEFLQLHQCDHIQGYICSKPLPADEFFALLVKIAGKAANSDDAVEATA